MDALDGIDLAARSSMEAKEYWVHLDVDGSLEKYPAKQHARRVQEKLGIDEGLIYLAGQAAKNNEDSDMPAPFRQRRYFYYLTGCNEPSCHMTYDIQHDTLSLFIPRIDPKRVIWNGRGSTLAEAVERYDIDEVYYVDELGDIIKDWSAYYGGHGSDIYVLHNGQLPRIPGLHAIIDSGSLQPAMNVARMIKDDHEISLIRKANNISSEAHKKVLANITRFKNEAQVEGLFMDVCISHQAKQQAYDPIAASGPNAGTLHYDANNENFEDRQLMCLDAGCEYELYASDITRTFPLAESWPSKEAENIYKLVERMQESCIERLAPGVRYLDLHVLAHQIAIDGLLKLGILHNGTREEIYAAGTSRAFFPHGLGHHVGLEVHDVGQAELMSVRRGKAVVDQVPSLFPQNFHTPVFDPALCHAPTDTQSSQLEEGMVVTVEPGIYFSIYALQHFYLPSPIHSRFINQRALQRYMPVGGVRIEDDILITSKGYENLTTAPKGNAMFDIIRGNKSTVKNPKRSTASSSPATEPQLFRAPGCPLQTPPPAMQSIKRAATMPNESTQEQIGGFKCLDHSLVFRRSMTTDERVQYWRQSCQRPSFSRQLQPTRPEPATVCGSSSNAVSHLYIGRNCTSSIQTEGLSQCTNCAILSQTLVRLRQNLKESAQRSPQQVQEAWDSRSPTTSPQRVSMTPSRATAYVENRMLGKVVTKTTASVEVQPQSDHICQGPPVEEQPLPLRAVPKYPLVQCVASPDRNVASDEGYNSQSAHPMLSQTSDIPNIQAAQVNTAMPFRLWASQRQGRRRPSNHMDDRDWMA